MKKHHVELPSAALGFLDLKQLRVDNATLERIITMTNGDLDLQNVMTAARKLKIRLQGEDDKKKRVWWQDINPDAAPDNTQDVDHDGADDELDVLEMALRELDGDADPLSEGEALEVLMNLIEQKVSGPVQNMTYRQAQNAKQYLRNSRGFRQGLGKGSTRPPNHAKPDIAHLKSVTRCRNCNQVGHWHRECPCGQAWGDGNQSGI